MHIKKNKKSLRFSKDHKTSTYKRHTINQKVLFIKVCHADSHIQKTASGREEMLSHRNPWTQHQHMNAENYKL